MRYTLALLILFLIGQKVHSQGMDTFANRNYYTNFDNYPNSKTPINNSLPLKYKVFRIKEIDKAYIIDIDVKDKTRHFRYTIISLKSENEKQDLKKIKRGKRYEFILFAYHSFTLIGDPIYIYYTINGIRVGFGGDLKTGEIVTTPNLQGLYYIPPNK